MTHDGQAVGTAVILRHGPDAFILVGATDSGPVRAGPSTAARRSSYAVAW